MSELSNILNYLKLGELVILSTDTLYAVCADATSEAAVEKIFRVKNRAKEKCIPVFMSSLQQVKQFCYLNDLALVLAEKFWPGPLTIILKSRNKLASNISISDTVAVRVPNNALVRQVIQSLDRPITGTSANLSGKSSILYYNELVATFEHLVSFIAKGELCGEAKASTIVDISSGKIEVVRQGCIPSSLIMDAVGFR